MNGGVVVDEQGVSRAEDGRAQRLPHRVFDVIFKLHLIVLPCFDGEKKMIRAVGKTLYAARAFNKWILRRSGGIFSGRESRSRIQRLCYRA